jgi:hypothetical protein
VFILDVLDALLLESSAAAVLELLAAPGSDPAAGLTGSAAAKLSEFMIARLNKPLDKLANFLNVFIRPPD